jgi:hypothetical protein
MKNNCKLQLHLTPPSLFVLFYSLIANGDRLSLIQQESISLVFINFNIIQVTNLYPILHDQHMTSRNPPLAMVIKSVDFTLDRP